MRRLSSLGHFVLRAPAKRKHRGGLRDDWRAAGLWRSAVPSRLKQDDASDRFTLMHQIEGSLILSSGIVWVISHRC